MKEIKKIMVYIAGPYTNGDAAVNVRNALEVADDLLSLQFIPVIPHLSHFWHFMSPKGYNLWLEYDKELLKRCDAIYRINGDSPGADEEVRYAESKKIPVFFSRADLIAWRWEKSAKTSTSK